MQIAKYIASCWIPVKFFLNVFAYSKKYNWIKTLLLPHSLQTLTHKLIVVYISHNVGDILSESAL